MVVAPHFAENHGAKVWKRAPIRHFPGKSYIKFTHHTSNTVIAWKHVSSSSLLLFNSYSLLTSSDYRSNVAPSDSDRDCPSRRDSDSHHQHIGQAPPRLGITAPSADSESCGSNSPSPRASRRRSKIRNHSLTSLCLISHHPFFTTFRECLFVLKKLIGACNESSSSRCLGGSRHR